MTVRIIRNDGEVREGELVQERESYYVKIAIDTGKKIKYRTYCYGDGPTNIKSIEEI